MKFLRNIALGLLVWLYRNVRLFRKEYDASIVLEYRWDLEDYIREALAIGRVKATGHRHELYQETINLLVLDMKETGFPSDMIEDFLANNHTRLKREFQTHSNRFL